MKRSKQAITFILLAAAAAGMVALNVYLWNLQNGKKALIGGLESQVEQHGKENKLLSERNESKAKEIETLQSPDSYYVYEEKAREEYGMIGKNETYFVLTGKELDSIPDIPNLAAVKTNAQDDTRQIPADSPSKVLQLESAAEPPAVAPAVPEQTPADAVPAPPLRLESLQ